MSPNGAHLLLSKDVEGCWLGSVAGGGDLLSLFL